MTNQERALLKKPLAILIFTIAILLVSYTFYLNASYKKAEISELHVGYFYDGKKVMSEVIPEGSYHIFVCGELTSRSHNYLNITLHNVTEDRFYGYDNTSDPFNPGQFCSEFQLDEPLLQGEYKIVITDRRESVGNVQFIVR